MAGASGPMVVGPATATTPTKKAQRSFTFTKTLGSAPSRAPSRAPSISNHTLNIFGIYYSSSESSLEIHMILDRIHNTTHDVSDDMILYDIYEKPSTIFS